MKSASPPVPGWVAIRKTEQIPIPTADGKGIAQFIEAEVDAWRDPETGEIYLDGDAIDLIDRIKARHMGILTAEEIKALRHSFGLSQRELSELLRIGEKSWSRWESGREHPSHSMNLLLQALRDGIIPLSYLQSHQSPQFSIWEGVDVACLFAPPYQQCREKQSWESHLSTQENVNEAKFVAA